MPGLNDPSSILIPQQPIPRMILSWSKRFGTMLNCVTNPYKFSLNEINFLGTSGNLQLKIILPIHIIFRAKYNRFVKSHEWL